MAIGPMKSKTPRKPAKRLRTEVIAAMPTITPAELIRAPKITQMNTLWQCRKVLRGILRSMAKGDIPSQLGARLAYVANLIAALTKQELELKELTQLREQLAALRGRGPVALIQQEGDCIPTPEEPS